MTPPNGAGSFVDVDWTFTFHVPDGFLVVDPDWAGADDDTAIGEAVDRHLDELAKPELTARRDDRVSSVAAFVRTAAAARAIGAALSVDCVEGGKPVEAFVLAMVVEGFDETSPDALEALAAELRAEHPGDVAGREVAIVRLPAGRAVRLQGIFETDPGEAESTLVEDVQHWLPVPHTGTQLVLTCSTPQLAFAEHAVPVFDAIARTVEIQRPPKD
jgi:hypothetical protein